MTTTHDFFKRYGLSMALATAALATAGAQAMMHSRSHKKAAEPVLKRRAHRKTAVR
jgi:hypothetical protein